MTHVPEEEIHERVRTWLSEWFTDGAVEHEPTLETARVPDYRVHTPIGLPTLLVEVENGWEPYDIGQAAVYAAIHQWSMDSPSMPVFVVPDEALDDAPQGEIYAVETVSRWIDGVFVNLPPQE